MAQPERSQPPFQFSIRTLLWVTALCAVAAWAWPFRNDANALLHLSLVLYFAATIVAGLLVGPAYRGLMNRATDNLMQQRAKKISFFSAVLGMIPFSSIWPVAWMLSRDSEYYFGPFSTLLTFAAFVSYGPSILFAVVSFTLYTGRCDNPPLFFLRVIGLVANLTIPINLLLV
jgi:hypothetical protein